MQVLGLAPSNGASWYRREKSNARNMLSRLKNGSESVIWKPDLEEEARIEVPLTLLYKVLDIGNVFAMIRGVAEKTEEQLRW